MVGDIEKASLLKRASAFLLDIILVAVLATGVAYLMSVILGYDKQIAIYDEAREKYETMYGVKFDIPKSDYEAFTPEQKANYDEAKKALSNDEEAMRAYGLAVSFVLLITTFCLLISILIIEFVVPLFLKHGRTVGKKVFGLAVVQANGVKITGVALFARSILGKYVLETMIPVYLVLMIMFGMLGVTGTIVIALIGIAQIVLLIVTKNNTLIHDIISFTVVVDYSTQRIFDSADALVAYQKQLAAEKAKEQEY